MIRLLLARGRVLLFALVALAAPAVVAANIPATAVMTLYRFNGDLNLPYYDIERFAGFFIAGAETAENEAGMVERIKAKAYTVGEAAAFAHLISQP